jgi:hypothetical protein
MHVQSVTKSICISCSPAILSVLDQVFPFSFDAHPHLSEQVARSSRTGHDLTKYCNILPNYCKILYVNLYTDVALHAACCAGMAPRYRHYFKAWPPQEFDMVLHVDLAKVCISNPVCCAGVPQRYSHYFHAWLPQQFDMVLHIDETSAVTPLDPIRKGGSAMEETDVPDLFPSGV